jgi:hypothetical protein
MGGGAHRERTSTARLAALEVDGGLLQWSSSPEKMRTVFLLKRQRRWRGDGVGGFLERR